MWNSRRFFKGIQGARRRSIYYACGYGREDLEGPHIGIVNAFNEAAPGHVHVRSLAEAVKSGVWAAGGVPFEFNCISTCGAVCVGTEHLKYELVIRDVIASSIEIVVQEHLFDGIVIISSCDSIIPGQILGALRLDRPTIMVTGGPMPAGEYKGHQILQNEFDEKVLSYKGTGMDGEAEEILAMEKIINPGPGACPLMGTANTMQVISEALGLSLPGTATISSVSSEKIWTARKAGKRIVEMVEEGLNIRKIITKEALRNAVAVDLAVGGSTNAVLHLLSFAKEVGIPFNLDEFDELSRNIPCICSVVPNGPNDVNRFHKAGGVPAVMHEIKNFLHSKAITVTGQSIETCFESPCTTEKDVIRPLESEFNQSEGLAVLRGNICPDGAICRPVSFNKKMLKFRGNARVFDSDDEAYKAIVDGSI